MLVLNIIKKTNSASQAYTHMHTCIKNRWKTRYQIDNPGYFRIWS